MILKQQRQAEKSSLTSDDVKFSPYLWLYILIGLFTGLAVGFGLSVADLSVPLKKDITEWLALPGYVFLDLLKMIIIPLIISSIVLGIAVSHDKAFLKRLGMRIIPYFILTTAIAITIGLSLVHIIQPGQYVDQNLLQSSIEVSKEFEVFEDLTVPQRIRNMIPVNMARAEYHNQLLQIVIFAIILGVIVLNLPERKTKVAVELAEFAQTASMVVVGWAIKLAPLAVFGLLASVTAKIGFAAISSMATYMLTVVAGLAGVLIAYGLIVAVFAQRNPFTFFKNIRVVQLLAFSTSSSSGVMPVTISAAETRLNIRPEVSRFVVPLGATINMDGTALYQGVAAVFLTQVFGIDLTLMQTIILLLTTIGASIGTPGTPGVGLIVLATIVSGIGVPPEGIALILGVDRILDMCRTTINVTGDLTACAVMDRWLPASKEANLLESAE